MAGDWIPIRCNLHDDPAVIAIAAATGLDEFAVVGRLVKLWSWANQHTADGNASSVTESWIDRYIGVTGFARAMLAAGWLTLTPAGVEFPNFGRWNGQSAKRRVETNRRVSEHRQRAGVTPVKRECNASGVTESVTREEKRREEKKREDPPTPRGGGDEGRGPEPEREAEPQAAPEATPAVGPRPADVVAHWNAFPGLTPAVADVPNRDMKIRAWATQEPLWVAHWRAAIAYMGRTPLYCGGGGGPQPWRATLAWLFKDSNFATVVERMLAEGTRAPPGGADPPARRETVAERVRRQAAEAAGKRDSPPGVAPCPNNPTAPNGS